MYAMRQVTVSTLEVLVMMEIFAQQSIDVCRECAEAQEILVQMKVSATTPAIQLQHTVGVLQTSNVMMDLGAL